MGLPTTCNQNVGDARSEPTQHSLGDVLGSELSLKLMTFADELANSQRPMDAELAKVLSENLWDLYAD
jgi:hypothetical protein